MVVLSSPTQPRSEASEVGRQLPRYWLTLERVSDYPPHSHSGLTTHVILSGQLTIAYPEDGDAEQRKQRTTYGVGDRIDVDAGCVHEVWIGAGGCTYVIGE